MNLTKLKKIGISYSKMKLFLGCKKEFWYVLNNWYYPLSNRNKNTYFGNLCHYIAEFPYLTSPGINKLFKICVEYDGKNPKNITGVDDQDLSNDKLLAITVMHELYSTKHMNQAKEDFKILKREQYLRRVKIGTHVCNLKIDKILKNKRTGFFWPLDIKCKGRYNEIVTKQKLAIDKQLLLYAKGITSVYKLNVEGVTQEIIRKPGLRMTQKDGNLQNFMERVSKDIKSRPEYYYQYNKQPLTVEIVKDFNCEFEQIMQEIYQCMEKGEKAFYKNDTLCEAPYKCDFFQACTSGNMNQYLKNF